MKGIPDLKGIVIVTGDNCPNCTKLINMMNKLGVKYRTKTQQELAKMKITTIPTILKDGVRVLGVSGGCPGSVKDLKIVLKM